MDDSNQFCLRWNKHQSTLVSVFDNLLKSENFVDCTLAAEGKFLKAHKIVLSACSPYFASLLSHHYDKHPIFILKDVKFEELQAIIEFMYRGEVNITHNQLNALLKVAKSLQIKGLCGDSENPSDSENSSPLPSPVVRKRKNIEEDENETPEKRTKASSIDDTKEIQIKQEKFDNIENESTTANSQQDAGSLKITKIAGLSWDQWNERLSLPLVTTLREDSNPNENLSIDMSSSSSPTGGLSCPDCGRVYKLKSSLKNHQKWECGKEPQFECPYCEYKAKQKMHISRHMERVHKDKVYKIESDGKVVAMDNK